MTLIYRNPKNGCQIHQAGILEIPSILSKEKIDLLILAAKEIQPKSIPIATKLFKKVPKIYIPLNDTNHLSTGDYLKLFNTVDYICETLRLGKNVLITCHMGLNRSGLITGLVLKKLLKIPGDKAIQLIKSHRPNALFNNLFEKIILTDI